MRRQTRRKKASAVKTWDGELQKPKRKSQDSKETAWRDPDHIFRNEKIRERAGPREDEGIQTMGKFMRKRGAQERGLTGKKGGKRGARLVGASGG